MVLSLSNQPAGPLIYHCPSDKRKPAKDWTDFKRENASYFLGVGAGEKFPQAFLAGDRNIETNGVLIGAGWLQLTGSNVAWNAKLIHRAQGNIALGDGSVMQLSSVRLRDQLAHTELTTNVWIFP